MQRGLVDLTADKHTDAAEGQQQRCALGRRHRTRPMQRRPPGPVLLVQHLRIEVQDFARDAIVALTRAVHQGGHAARILAHRVAARRQQRPRDRNIAPPARIDERCRHLTVPRVEVGIQIHKLADDIHRARQAGNMQRRLALVVRHAHARATLGKQPNGRDVLQADSPHQRRTAGLVLEVQDIQQDGPRARMSSAWAWEGCIRADSKIGAPVIGCRRPEAMAGRLMRAPRSTRLYCIGKRDSSECAGLSTDCSTNNGFITARPGPRAKGNGSEPRNASACMAEYAGCTASAGAGAGTSRKRPSTEEGLLMLWESRSRSPFMTARCTGLKPRVRSSSLRDFGGGGGMRKSGMWADSAVVVGRCAGSAPAPAMWAGNVDDVVGR
eukprot:m.105839 g.105839  ORF g.105839 m.105839 type:complete len:382 (+) comp8929_c0_seq2:743-1888(+)